MSVKKADLLKTQSKIFLRGIKLINKLAPGVMILQFCATFFKAVIPYVSIFMSAKILTELVGNRNLPSLIIYVAITIGATLLAVILNSLFNYFIMLKEKNLTSELDILMNDKTYSMDYAQASQKETNDLRAQIEMNDRASIGGLRVMLTMCGSAFEGLFSVIIAIVICVGMLKTYAVPTNSSVLIRAVNSPYFSIALLIFTIFCILFLCMAQIKAHKSRKKFLSSMAHTNLLAEFYLDSYFDENKAAKDIRIFNQMPFIKKEYYENVLLTNWQNMKEFLTVNSVFQIKTAAVTASLGGLVYLFIGLKAWSGVIDVGEVVKYYGAVTQMIFSFISLFSAAISLINNNVFVDTLFKYLDLPSRIEKGTLLIPDCAREKSIEFKNVSFRYSSDSPYALKNISLEITPGRRLAIVGMNGSGKTTLIKLLCRFYEPSSGKIIFDGVNIDEYDYEEYKKLFSVVFQDFRLFSFSVGCNISGNMEYDNEAVWHALELAGVKSRVEQFTKKLEHTLYKDFDVNGVELSGGEEQKFALARAIYKNSPFVILDEPTAALDPLSELEIYEKFNEITQDKTVIYISHRLSSCKFCDKIIVFDHGEIVQSGTHEELLKNQNGKYAELWNAQAQYYSTKSN